MNPDPSARSPLERVRGVLWALALLSVPVTIATIALVPTPSRGRWLTEGATLVLGLIWWIRRPQERWTTTEQVTDGILLCAAAAASGSPVATLATFYGGVYYRALADQGRGATRAAVTYQAIFIVALVVAHPHLDARFWQELLAALPGFAFAAFLMNALGKALRGHARAQDEAHQGEIRFQKLLDEAADGIIVVGPDLIIQVANRAVRTVLGYQEAELLGQKITAFLSPDDLAHNSLRIDALRQGEHVLTERPITRRDGGVVIAEINARMLDDGSVEAVVRDVTARRESERALRESEERFRHFVETAHEGVVATDAVGCITYANDRLATMLGYPIEELLGRQTFDFMTPDSAFAARTLFAHAQLGFSKLHEFAFRHRNGEELWMLSSSSPLRSTDGQFAGALTMITDITRRREVEQQLMRSNETLTTLVETAPLAIVVIDREYLVTLWNPAAERLLGWSAAEIVGHPLPTVPDALHAEFLELRHREEHGEEIRGVEQRRQRKDGGEVDIYLSSAPIRNAEGEIIGSIGLYADITQRKQLEEQLRQAHKMEAVGQLAGGVAHDFNNILTVIKANAAFLLDGCPSCSAALAEAHDIDYAADRAASLTNQLLAFSRKQVIRPQAIEVSSVLQKLETLLRRLVPENIEQRVVVDEATGHILIDPGQFEQIVINLVVNARDAMPHGGQLGIGASRVLIGREEAARIGDGHIVPGRYVRLTVTDTGSGMDEETLARAFEPFFTTKPVGEGTGLGLSMIYGIASQNDGAIAIDSQRGSGTTVRVYLPMCDAPKLSLRTQAESAPLRGSETVLVVEDESAICTIIERVLRARGYVVLSAPSGTAALTTTRSYDGAIDLLLTDVILPGMSGAVLAETLRVERPGIRVLYMSGYTDDHLVHEGVLARDVDLLGKPFEPNQLLHRVRGALDGVA